MPEPQPEFNHNRPVYTVSEISTAVKRVLEDQFGVVRLRGEVSGWKGAHSSGHAYFSLKDDQAVIGAVCWRGTLSKLPHKPEEGMEVIATGRISAYNGKYQIVVEHIEPAGLGALMALLEKRKKQFQAEGLFDPARKKPLPFLPGVVGVVTSPTGAVIRDILHRLSDRFPVHVLVWPVAVQGEGAAEQIAAAIEGFNSLPPAFSPENAMRPRLRAAPSADGVLAPRPDVLIVARGGGSIEDLWAFNEEIVVRAAAASKIPLISAVGHETDTTLIDYVSDKRAPTPTAAAEMAVPVREDLLTAIRELEGRQRAVASRLFEHAAQRLDDWTERLLAALPKMLERKAQLLRTAAAAIQPRLLLSEMNQIADRISSWQKRSGLAWQRMLEARQDRLAHFSALLESVNYQKVLERGFALVKDKSGKLVTSAKKAAAETELQLTFKDGSLKVRP